MNAQKEKLIDLILERGILRFGQFTLKSGRISPYFFNTGLFYHADSLKLLGKHYAETIISNNIKFENLFGPAYKGISLATATALALSERGVNCTLSFDRKEAKDHGEMGIIIGAPLTGKTILIDDVITAGTTFYAAKNLIDSHGGKLVAVVIALDRCERSNFIDSSPEQQTEKIEFYSILTVYDLIYYLEKQNKIDLANEMQNYLKEYKK